MLRFGKQGRFDLRMGMAKPALPTKDVTNVIPTLSTAGKTRKSSEQEDPREELMSPNQTQVNSPNSSRLPTSTPSSSTPKIPSPLLQYKDGRIPAALNLRYLTKKVIVFISHNLHKGSILARGVIFSFILKLIGAKDKDGLLCYFETNDGVLKRRLRIFRVLTLLSLLLVSWALVVWGHSTSSAFDGGTQGIELSTEKAVAKVEQDLENMDDVIRDQAKVPANENEENQEDTVVHNPVIQMLGQELGLDTTHNTALRYAAMQLLLNSQVADPSPRSPFNQPAPGQTTSLSEDRKDDRQRIHSHLPSPPLTATTIDEETLQGGGGNGDDEHLAQDPSQHLKPTEAPLVLGGSETENHEGWRDEKNQVDNHDLDNTSLLGQHRTDQQHNRSQDSQNMRLHFDISKTAKQHSDTTSESRKHRLMSSEPKKQHTGTTSGSGSSHLGALPRHLGSVAEALEKHTALLALAHSQIQAAHAKFTPRVSSGLGAASAGGAARFTEAIKLRGEAHHGHLGN